MCTQGNTGSAFIESMKQIECYEEWIEPSEKIEGSYTIGNVSKNDIDQYYQKGKWLVDFKGGSYYQIANRLIYVFTIAIVSESENDYSDYSYELHTILRSINKNVRDLISLSVKVKGESGSFVMYYLQLVFPRI